MPTKKRAESLATYVTIVSRNPETLDGLQDYLGRVGIPSHTTRALSDVKAVAPEHATATVIFPDDFAEASVLALVLELRRKRPRLLILLITRSPNRFRATLCVEDPRSVAPIVLPKPLFGWVILDAIRGQSVKTPV
jgi:hypothetical protein